MIPLLTDNIYVNGGAPNARSSVGRWTCMYQPGKEADFLKERTLQHKKA